MWINSISTSTDLKGKRIKRETNLKKKKGKETLCQWIINVWCNIYDDKMDCCKIVLLRSHTHTHTHTIIYIHRWWWWWWFCIQKKSVI